MTLWIENVAWDDVVNGWHSDLGPNCILIRIGDPDIRSFPLPKHNFVAQFPFLFLDAEDKDGVPEKHKISDEQAKELVDILQVALDTENNVIVHCHAGICRSGAVVEVGTMMGFTATERFRQPNLRVKHKMMKALGWSYDSDEKEYSVGGTTSAGGILIPFSGVNDD